MHLIVCNLLDDRILHATQSVTLSEGLNFQPALRMEDNCQNCGFNSLRMNGLEGAYSQILIDGRPIYNSLQGVYGLEQIPANMIDRVEVVRSGGSALYGSSAIAGTVNIITKEPINNRAYISTNQAYIGGKSADRTYMAGADVV
ncbi:TonB-dependent receptor plug domain-containing protein, partial [Ornithobacterium rhinotracheale]|uniref:TonB-dependent receptor plug domain-containing protein n=1 Tax=Ornithobacterium rhinotracheale TaxID=28251 RepID=UPI001FF43017